MHSYCLVSASGNRSRRVRVPQEMDQPPALKMRRSNAVQTRRLALHVSLLEKHMAVMESERARAVRQLREELKQLSTPRRPPNLSPRHARIMASGEQRYLAGGNVQLPKLTVSDKAFSVDGQTKPSVSHTDHLPQHTSAMPGGLEVSPEVNPATVSENKPGNASKDGAILHRLTDKSSGELVGETHAALSTDVSPIPAVHQSSTLITANPVQPAPENGRRSGVYLRRNSSGHPNVTYTVGLPFKATTMSRRGSKSLLTFVHSKDVSQGQNLSQDPGTSDGTAAVPQEGGKGDATHVQQPSKDSGASSDGKGDAQEPPHQIQGTGKHHAKLRPPNKEDQSHYVNHVNIVSTPEIRPPSRSLYKSKHATRPTKSPKLLCPLAGTPNHRCSLFPCVQPHTYHSLGFHPDTSIYPWRSWISRNACRPHHRLAPGRPLPPVGIDGRRTPADAAGYMKRKRLGKEEVVRLDMARKKQLHALARPPSWNTNYGQPVPLKRLKNPVRLMPLE